MGSLDIPHVFVHADEQVYAWVVQLIWKYKEELDIIIVGRTKVFKNGLEIFECNHEEGDTNIPLFEPKSTESVVAVAQDCDIDIAYNCLCKAET